MSLGWEMGPKVTTVTTVTHGGQAVNIPIGPDSSILATRWRKAEEEQAVCPPLSGPQDTGQSGAISKMGREQGGDG